LGASSSMVESLDPRRRRLAFCLPSQLTFFPPPFPGCYRPLLFSRPLNRFQQLQFPPLFFETSYEVPPFPLTFPFFYREGIKAFLSFVAEGSSFSHFFPFGTIGFRLNKIFFLGNRYYIYFLFFFPWWLKNMRSSPFFKAGFFSFL